MVHCAGFRFVDCELRLGRTENPEVVKEAGPEARRAPPLFSTWILSKLPFFSFWGKNCAKIRLS